MLINPTSHKVICFDWDDVLGVLREKDRSEPYFSDLDEGRGLLDGAIDILENDHNMKSYYYFDTHENKDYYIQAFARLEFKKIFNRIYEVNNQYTSPPLVVKIITTGSYKERKIKEALNQFYTDGKTCFNDSRFPVEYFNRNYWTKGASYDQKIHDLNKGKLMADNFPRWQKESPGLQETDVYFYDNSIFNVHDVRRHGFPNAVIFPTTGLPELSEGNYYSAEVIEEQGNLTFDKDGPAIFQQLHEIIDEYDINLMSHQIPLDEDSKEAILLIQNNLSDIPQDISFKAQEDPMNATKESSNDLCLCQIL